ncbi:Gfo/Idh/MocA family protein [Paenibacillus lignilyticus]|uniref:Gfo/Idh/MocA family oxidoreductase n=1 Tax=Paenibacillus lignilyticus TaxID=1172615 RepID=A0ABS5CIZ3_9BACL|nr:Gfo/Idh/MocA family oxidoreductase [Paenibacillus lignilyticus]MBP3965838.1 Gfo/Idh/MocA family oxidoreductase [Paenibacillus lignilyticus]
MNTVRAVLFGAGQRGMHSYATYALEHPEELQFVGICEPNDKIRENFRLLHGIAPEMSFETWEHFFDRGYDAGVDAVFICTQDDMHFEPAVKALELGYHVQLEKPMSNSPDKCFVLGEIAKQHKKVFTICHVLRYTDFFGTIKGLLDEGKIGQLISIQHNENVAYWHQAHSYVRGNWRNSEMSSPMILAKSSHDLDILLWLAGSDCTKLSSFGGLTHFKAENAPPGATKRCLDGCAVADTCPYFAPKIYIDWKDSWQGSVLRAVVCREDSDEAVMKALETGPYGRCVYHCDNNVVDHQVVNMEFANEVTASFTMCAFTKNESRTLKLMGTKGELRANMEKNEIELSWFGVNETETIVIDAAAKGHGGGDHGIVRDFVRQIREGSQQQSLTAAHNSVQSHLMAFAAEQSRLTNSVVIMEDYREKLRSETVRQPV